MPRTTTTMNKIGLLATVIALAAACGTKPSECGQPPPDATASDDVINLADRLASGRLRIVNRQATPIANGLRVSAAPGIGVIWIEGTDLADGTFEADVCGRDVYGESFVGLAFHRANDETYEAVYLRPFNFRSGSAERRQHAVQYFAMPDHDYARLRAASPGEFEHGVDPDVAPAQWNHLRLVIGNGRVQAFVGAAKAAALDVRALGTARHGQVGLYVDNGSDGVFANVRIGAARRVE
jgi:hypothetical protein